MQQNINTLWAGLHDYLQGFVLKKVGDKNVAQDIVQDVFLKVGSRITSLKDDKKLTSWIFQIARNTITDHFRQKKKDNWELSTVEAIEEMEVLDETKKLSQCILSMINDLPEKYKQAITLSEIEGMSQKELAKQLGISYSAAKSRVQRGREKLKEQLLQCCTITSDLYGNILDYREKSCPGDCE